MIGNPITTPEQLIELATNRKSVQITGYGYPVRLPASSLLYRQFRDTINLLYENRVFEYIKKPKEDINWFIKQKSK